MSDFRPRPDLNLPKGIATRICPIFTSAWRPRVKDTRNIQLLRIVRIAIDWISDVLFPECRNPRPCVADAAARLPRSRSWRASAEIVDVDNKGFQWLWRRCAGLGGIAIGSVEVGILNIVIRNIVRGAHACRAGRNRRPRPRQKPLPRCARKVRLTAARRVWPHAPDRQRSHKSNAACRRSDQRSRAAREFGGVAQTLMVHIGCRGAGK